MPMNDMFKPGRPNEYKNNDEKKTGFATRFVTQLMIAGLIFVVILVCYQKDNLAGDAVRYVVAMANADQSDYLAVSGYPFADNDVEDIPSNNETDNEISAHITDNEEKPKEWDTSAAYTTALGSNGRPELLLPASGVLMKSFGEVTAAGTVCKGLIISCNTDQQVKSSAAGTVTEATGEAGDYQLRVQHNGNTVTIYDGLHIMKVKKGDQVRQGDVLGDVIAGKELHFSVLADGKVVDPLDYLESPTGN